MPKPHHRHAERPAAARLKPSQQPTQGLIEQRDLTLPDRGLPAARLRTHTFHPLIYQRMLESVDRSALPGDVVEVIDRRGERFGFGLFNPRSEISVRMLRYGTVPPDEEFWQERLAQAVALRTDLLQLDSVTNAYRLVHAESDGLSGLVVDRYGDLLSAEVFSLGMFQRSGEIMRRLAELTGAQQTLVRVDSQIHGQEGFLADAIASEGFPEQTTITEHGTRFRVVFADGHKTGFFCDQRDNRKLLASYCRDRTVLDLCCYSGGFSVQAKRLGEAREVTGVDLDESALALARSNAALNQVRVNFVQSDAFGYMRDMLQNGRQYDVVVLDPPKLIRSRRELEEGTKKHFDLNRLAMRLVRPGGMLLTCSCSGLLSEEEFLRLIFAAGRQAGGPQPLDDSASPDSHQRPFQSSSRTVQLLAKTGASPDHPIAANCPETEYLRAMWLRIE